MRIRPITDTDIPAVATLMRSLSDEFIVHECSRVAAASFARENDESGVRAFVAAGMRYHVAENDDGIVGFIALRDNKHVFHMFVDKAHHRQGIANSLWQVARRAALDAGNPGVFTVNASNYAVPVYEVWGFVRTAETQCKNGIFYNPMQLGGEAS
jgi:GNAT superfamily N-acetyltransferase